MSSPREVENWLKDTTQDYRRGFIEGEAGERNIYLLEVGTAEYERGFTDGLKWRAENYEEEDQSHEQ